MSKFYTTSAPDSTTLIQYDSLLEALQGAKKEIALKKPLSPNLKTFNPGSGRYIVEVVAKVEEMPPPILTTFFRDEANKS